MNIEVIELRFVLSEIIAALPSRRDWLDPELEKAAKSLLAHKTPRKIQMEAVVNELKDLATHTLHNVYPERVRAGLEAYAKQLVAPSELEDFSDD